MSEVGDIWYRYDYTSRGYMDEWDSWHSRGVTVDIEKYIVEKVTPCGVRLRVWFGHGSFRGAGTRFVLMNWYGGRTTVKRFANPTKKQALEAFLVRKNRQRQLLDAQLKNVEVAIAIAENMSVGEDDD